jgi:hypothetical protein
MYYGANNNRTLQMRKRGNAVVAQESGVILRERDCLMRTVQAKKRILLVVQIEKMLMMKKRSRMRRKRMRLL